MYSYIILYSSLHYIDLQQLFSMSVLFVIFSNFDQKLLVIIGKLVSKRNIKLI